MQLPLYRYTEIYMTGYTRCRYVRLRTQAVSGREESKSRSFDSTSLSSSCWSSALRENEKEELLDISPPSLHTQAQDQDKERSLAHQTSASICRGIHTHIYMSLSP